MDLYAYCANKAGANRGFYENDGKYKLAKFNQGPRIFGYEDNWKYKICGDLIFGQCFENIGGDSVEDMINNDKLTGVTGEAKERFELSYTPEYDKPEKDEPKLDKNAKLDGKDVKEPILLEEDNNIKIDFNIDVKVDKLPKDKQQITDYLNKVENPNYDNYNKKGYFVYKNSIIIDILPDIFELIEGEGG